MKKLLSLLLVLALLLGTVSALGEADPVPETGEAGIPAVGDVVEGFEAPLYRQRRYKPRFPAVFPHPDDE